MIDLRSHFGGLKIILEKLGTNIQFKEMLQNKFQWLIQNVIFKID